MGTDITFSTADRSILITGDRPYEGCTYERLDGWYGIDKADTRLKKRPSAPGAFAPTQTYPDAQPISVEGKFFGLSRAAALQMREDLSELYNEGRPITMSVADDLRRTSREVLVESVDFPWTIHQEFDFTIDAVAPDPRRYGDTVLASTGLPQPGTGLSWPITWPLDWGTIPVNGRVTITNPGNADTYSRFVVAGGVMGDGFEIVNVTAGKRISYTGPVAGLPITIDARTRTATIGDVGAGSRYLTSPQWWVIPRRSSIEVQFLARGLWSGSPLLSVYTSPAYY